MLLISEKLQTDCFRVVNEVIACFLTLLPGFSLLLVILSFLKETPCLIQKAPELGESGCTYVSLRGWGSAVPTASHLQGRVNL